MQFVIGGVQKTSLLDYPDKISAIVFTQGCNFRCGYCHNPVLLQKNSEKDIYNVDVFFEFLERRRGKLDGIVITGGEPTLQKDLKTFIKKIKEMDYLVKLDTNGTNPNVIEELINENLIDYIAMDIKAPLDKYSTITNSDVNTEKIQRSIKLILNSNIDYEFRTTILSSQLTINDFEKIAKMLKGAKKYYLQKFNAKNPIYDETLSNEQTFTDTQFKKVIEILKYTIPFVEIR